MYLINLSYLYMLSISLSILSVYLVSLTYLFYLYNLSFYPIYLSYLFYLSNHLLYLPTYLSIFTFISLIFYLIYPIKLTILPYQYICLIHLIFLSNLII